MTQEEHTALLKQTRVMHQDGLLFYLADPEGNNDESVIKECDELWVCRPEFLEMDAIVKAVQIAARHNIPAYFVQLGDKEKGEVLRREIGVTMIRSAREQ